MQTSQNLCVKIDESVKSSVSTVTSVFAVFSRIVLSATTVVIMKTINLKIKRT